MSEADRSVLGLPALSEREALSHLLEAVAICESSARQLAYYTGIYDWALVAGQFAGCKSLCQRLSASARGGLIRHRFTD